MKKSQQDLKVKKVKVDLKEVLIKTIMDKSNFKNPELYRINRDFLEAMTLKELQLMAREEDEGDDDTFDDCSDLPFPEIE
jgi:hypothetical protein